MLSKEFILETIKNMPEEKFENIDILLERLVMPDKIQTGIEQLDRGEKVTVEELEKAMEEWDD